MVSFVVGGGQTDSSSVWRAAVDEVAAATRQGCGRRMVVVVVVVVVVVQKGVASEAMYRWEILPWRAPCRRTCPIKANDLVRVPSNAIHIMRRSNNDGGSVGDVRRG